MGCKKDFDFANSSYNVGSNIKGLFNTNMLLAVDVIVFEIDFTVGVPLARVNLANSRTTLSRTVTVGQHQSAAISGVLVPKKDLTVDCIIPALISPTMVYVGWNIRVCRRINMSGKALSMFARRIHRRDAPYARWLRQPWRQRWLEHQKFRQQLGRAPVCGGDDRLKSRLAR